MEYCVSTLVAMRRVEYLHYALWASHIICADLRKKSRHVIFIQSNNGDNEMNRNPTRTVALEKHQEPFGLVEGSAAVESRVSEHESNGAWMDLHRRVS
jgi:hypothetical protein